MKKVWVDNREKLCWLRLQCNAQKWFQFQKIKIKFIRRNATNFVFKICAWLYTGSHSMFAESIHSLADTINQLILAYGIHKSVQVSNQNLTKNYCIGRDSFGICFPDRWLRPSIRIRKYEICVVIDIWRWNILYRNGTVVLSRNSGPSESSSNRRLLLGELIVSDGLLAVN